MRRRLDIHRNSRFFQANSQNLWPKLHTKQAGMEATERLRILASCGPPSTRKRKGGKKMQPFNRFHSHLGRACLYCLCWLSYGLFSTSEKKKTIKIQKIARCRPAAASKNYAGSDDAIEYDQTDDAHMSKRRISQ